MDKIGEEKIDDADELEVESEEKKSGKEIEVDEEALPSRAMAIHEHIRQDGEKELERDAMALFWSAIAAGLSMGASLLAKGISMCIWKAFRAAFCWKASATPSALLSSSWRASSSLPKTP